MSDEYSRRVFTVNMVTEQDRDRCGEGEGLCRGVVVRAHSGRCLVESGGTTYRCQVRGRLKQGRRQVQSVVVVGDSVHFRLQGATGRDALSGVIEEVLPRRNKISRRAARRSGGRVEQVLMANLDQIVVVQSVREPAPQTGFVDRLLVSAEHFGVTGVLCLNKCDLVEEAAHTSLWNYYQKIGYAVLRTSAITGAGLADLREILQDRISILLGASGVGKSALLNALQPGLQLRVSSVGEKTGLGRHTTTRTELFPLAFGGFIADSPGLRGFDPWDIDPADLSHYFPDWQAITNPCRFRTCLHRDEPDCGVKDAVARGTIPEARHQAYLAMLRDLEEWAAEPGR